MLFEDGIRTHVRSGQGWLDSASSDESVSGGLQFGWKVDCRTSVCRSWLGLDSCDLQPEVVEELASLLLFPGLISRRAGEEFSWNGEAFAEDEVGG